MARTLTEESLTKISDKVHLYLVSHGTISNRELRALTGITYDQAIYYFNCMVISGKMLRLGKSSGTRYQLIK